MGSNHRPLLYKSSALTTELRIHNFCHKNGTPATKLSGPKTQTEAIISKLKLKENHPNVFSIMITLQS
jgi:hypothetical protein